MTRNRALEGIRVLEVGGALTNYCGKLFAELGADVILVEPPGGSDLRSEPPYLELPGDDGDGISLQYLYQNTSKRAVAVDLDNREGATVFRRMAKSVDLVLDGLSPGTLTVRGLGYDALSAQTPSLVMTSISPFGQEGPYAGFLHSDLICAAFGGMLWMGGYADGPPVRAAGDQAYMAGNLFGAVGAMIALTHAELTGEGQHVDVSVQEAVTMGLENAAQFYDLEGHIRTRFGGTQRSAGFGVFPCADGHVFLLASGIGDTRFWGNLVAWLLEEQVDEAVVLQSKGWGDREFMSTEAAKEDFWSIFTSFSKSKTKAELYHESQKRRVPLGPINKPSDVYQSSQLRDRDYFVDVETLGRIVEMPGAPYKLSETPWQLRGAAPGLGEHTDVVLSEFGFDTTERDRLRSVGAVL